MAWLFEVSQMFQPFYNIDKVEGDYDRLSDMDDPLARRVHLQYLKDTYEGKRWKVSKLLHLLKIGVLKAGTRSALSATTSLSLCILLVAISFFYGVRSTG